MVTESTFTSCIFTLASTDELPFLGSQLFPIVGQGVKMLVRHKSTQEYMTPFTSFNHALENIP